jgi:outer membrane receptor protein involved in Fe transport
VGWAGPVTTLDVTNINIAKTEVEAYDIQVDYTAEAGGFGEVHVYALATWEPRYRNRILVTDPLVERVGFAGGPLEWRGNFGLEWQRGPWGLGWSAQYYHSYWVYTALALPLTPAQVASRANGVLNQGSATVPHQIYHDMIASYRFEGTASWAGGLLANAELSVGIQNLFDTSPPILASTSTTAAGYSTYGDPRLRRYSISLRKTFGR